MSNSPANAAPGAALDRRAFLRLGAGAGGALVAAFQWPLAARAADAQGEAMLADGWLIIGADNRITIRLAAAEMGQGVYTSMPALVAEELEVDVASVAVEMAPVADTFKNLVFNAQATGGSTSIRWSYNVLRQVGARVREALRLAAANRWSVPVVECSAADAHILHPPTQRALRYGALASAAARLPLPAEVPFKPRAKWRQLGRALPRLDSSAKSTGAARFGIDVRLQGMLVGTVAASPVFGGRLAHVDSEPALARAGVRQVIKLPDAVIVLADGFWQARKGLQALSPVWDSGPNKTNSSERIRASLRDGLAREGAEAERDGDAASAIEAAQLQVEATYEVPLLAHATMEPMNATADVRADGAQLWLPTQSAGLVPAAVARVTGLAEEQIRVHTTLLGGGFGRRFEMDFVLQAALASKLARRPVQLVWSREEDMRHDFYRPAAAARLRAGLTDGEVSGLEARLCSPSIMSRVFPESVRNGVDSTAVEGLADNIYAWASLKVDYVRQEVGVPVGFWRAVGYSHNTFFLESFVDELAARAGRDPLAFRQGLLAEKPRHLQVLNRAAELGGWNTPRPGRVRGVAIAASFGSIVAQVVEISVTDHHITIHEIACAVDCGVAIDPGVVEAQVQSAIAYGLAAAANGSISIRKGAAVESNFHDYPVLRIEQMPVINTVIVESDETTPGGMGEPALPPLAPALTNALFAATGERVRALPLRDAGYTLG